MISDITIGQYFPGNSFVHKLDARMKVVLILALVVSIFICKNIVSLAVVVVATVLLVLLSKIPVKTILKSIKPLAIIIMITALLNLFYGDGEPLVQLGKLKITQSGIETAVFMAIRIITLVVISSLLTYTTSPTELTDALERLFKPLKIFKIDVHSIAMTMTIALRFIPTLIEEIDKIMSAQKSRGADMESGGLIHRAKALVPVLIPLFVSSFRRANELAYAMECRCYRGGEGRTKMKVMKMSARDYISLVVVILFIAGLVVINHFMKNVI
jgi:energy-coupling factor transport system permease protein